MFGAPIFGCLYPLASGTALAAGFAANRLVLSAGSASDTALVVSLVVAIVVFWPMCRLDQRLAMSVPPYRWARHVARIFIIGFLITVNVMGGSGVNFLPHSMLEVQLMIANSRYLIVMAVSVVIAHLFLTKMNFVRTFWGNWLEVLKLRAG